VRLRYADRDTFVERFAPNVTRGGVFLASRTPRPEGEVFRFEVQLADGTPVLAGDGKVIWVKPFNPAEPQKAHGMGVQFVRIDPEHRETLDRILKAKGAPATRAPQAAQPATPSTTAAAAAPTTAASPAGARAGANGRPRVDTSVDLAAEYGIDDSALRRIIDRNWALGARSDEEIDALVNAGAEPDETVTLAQALADLPRLLDPVARRRSGAFRSLESLAADKPAAAPVVVVPAPAVAPAPPTPTATNTENGASDPNEITSHDAPVDAHPAAALAPQDAPAAAAASGEPAA
jgi:uncharacterized protein (TIGR02266 family)